MKSTQEIKNRVHTEEIDIAVAFDRGDRKEEKSKRSMWEKEDLRSMCKYRRHKVQRHSYMFNEYVPDFENRCYRLQFQCEYCGDEIFDKINDEYGENYNDWKQTDTSEVATRYYIKQPKIPVVCVQRIKLRGEGLFVSGIRSRG